MRDDRLLRVLRPSLALLALAALLILLGTAITGTARAETASPKPDETRSAGPVAGSGQTALPAPDAVQRGAEVRAGEDVIVPAGTSVPSVVAFGGDVTVDGRAAEAVAAFGGNVIVNGSVGNSVVAFGGDITVNGTVGATIVAFGGDVRLGETAVVGFDVPPDEASVVLLGGNLYRADGAQVHGLVKRSVGNVDWGEVLGWGAQGVFFNPLLGLSFFGWLFQTAFFIVLALVAAALMPRQLRGVQAQLARTPWASLGWGALTFFIIAPAVLVVLVISVIGLLLVLPYLVFVALAYFFATTGVAAFLAQKALTGFGGKENLMLAVAVGVVGTTVVSRIPAIGPVVLVVMMVIGTGAAALAVLKWRRERRAAEAAQVAAVAAQQPVLAAAVIQPIVQTSPAMQGPPQPPIAPPQQPPVATQAPPAPAAPAGEAASPAMDAGLAAEEPAGGVPVVQPPEPPAAPAPPAGAAPAPEGGSERPSPDEVSGDGVPPEEA
jgi:hypothetical protein